MSPDRPNGPPCIVPVELARTYQVPLAQHGGLPLLHRALYVMAEVDVRLQSGGLRIAVRDTEIGIEPELLPEIFEPFLQGHRTLDRSQGGLGIGLTLVRTLVEMHGGAVTAQSAGTGEGSELVVLLPLVDGAGDVYP